MHSPDHRPVAGGQSGLPLNLAASRGSLIASNGYLAVVLFCFPKRRSNLATRPPVSRIFCLPV
jgi:hypothetical protein